MDIQNPTEAAYEDCDLVIRPTEAIAAIAQSSPFSDVTFEDKNESALRLLDMNLGAGTSKVFPVVLLATDAGYRMRCTRLPAHSTIKIVVALVDMKWNPQRRPNTPLEQQVRDPNYVIREKDDCATYWFGHKEGDVYALRPTSTEWLRVEGTYKVAHRTWHISEKIQIGGEFREAVK